MIDLKDAIDEINNNISFKGAKMLTEGECVILLRDLEYMLKITEDIPLDRLSAICAAEREGRLVEVVRCGECKHYSDCWAYHKNQAAWTLNVYCSCGERRERE
jgi:hypothetical protein